MLNELYDVIIIGGGPAGVSTALYAVRGGLSVALVHNGKSALHRAERIENYYGAGSSSGAELYTIGIAQAESLGATVIFGEVTFVKTDGETFTVSLPTGEINSRKLVVATGAARRTVDIRGLKELEGKGVSYCAVCDAFFYRKKRVGVLGAGEFALHEYSVLKNTVGQAAVFTNGEKAVFSADAVYTQKIKRVFAGDGGRLGGVELDDGSVIDLDGLFVALGVMGSGAIAKSVGLITDDRGAIKADAHGMTNIKGLYAAGDCTDGIKQIGKAVADGVNVGMSLIADLKRGG